MNNITYLFEQSNNEVRFVNHPEDKYAFGIIAADVATALEIQRTSDLLSSIDDIYKGVASTRTPGGMQEMKVIWEPGLYQALAKSRKPKAKIFQSWLFEEVLPSIREKGYFAPNLSPAQLLMKYAEQYLRIEQEQERAAAERKALQESQVKTEATLAVHTEQISNIHDRLATLSEFVSTPVDTPEQTIRNLLAKAFQELGSILAEQGEDKAKAYSEPWRELGLEMRNSALKYDLNARYSNEKKKHKQEVAEWKANGSPRGHKPKGLSRPDILERDGKLAEGFKFAKKIVQQYISKLS